MGEPNKKRVEEPTRLEQVSEKDSARDQFTAKNDTNAYRAMVIDRLDQIIELLAANHDITKANARATALLAKSIQDAMEEPDQADAEPEATQPAAVAS